MPLWNLSEEKVDELIKLMNEKKKDHDSLEAKHIYDLWNTDLE
jgi:hypothetical protein